MLERTWVKQWRSAFWVIYHENDGSRWKKQFYERYVLDKQKVWIKNSKFFETSTQKYAAGMQDI